MTRIALLALLLAAAAAHVLSGDVVQINGWYHCNPSTFDRTGDQEAHSRDYYMETKALHSKSGAAQGKRESTSNADARFPLRSKGRQSFAVLGQSFEMSQMLFEQPETEPSAKHGAKTNKRGVKKGYYQSIRPKFECASFRVPMCYEGVCESNRTIEIFVKRTIAKEAPEGHRNKSLWVLQGGPGASSTAMEGLMETMHLELDGQVSLYTMDHRGTARSNRLECKAAEAQTPGSPDGTTIAMEEVADCISDLLFEMDNQTAAYSVTSAAMDLKSIIGGFLAEEDVYVYGLSYGTYLVERLMHFAPPSVKGFIIDGIVSETGSTVEERSTYSNWDHDVGVVGDRFLKYCMADPFCSSKFPNVRNLTAFTKDLYARLDDAATRPGENKCADALLSSGKKPSYFLRSTFGEFIMTSKYRIAIPAVIFRSSRCNARDVDALRALASYMGDSDDDDEDDDDLDDVLFMSEMLYDLIVYSEMWEYPSPNKATLVKWYEDAVMASENFYALPYYCMFTGSREDACKELKNLPPSRPMRYERDHYWNVTAKLADNVTALLLTGGLDPQTLGSYGELEYGMLQGRHMHVEFDYAGHCTTFTTPTRSGGPTCGVQILASYVRENGDLARVDTSCVADIIDLNFHGDRFLALLMFDQQSLYD